MTQPTTPKRLTTRPVTAPFKTWVRWTLKTHRALFALAVILIIATTAANLLYSLTFGVLLTRVGQGLSLASPLTTLAIATAVILVVSFALSVAQNDLVNVLMADLFRSIMMQLQRVNILYFGHRSDTHLMTFINNHAYVVSWYFGLHLPTAINQAVLVAFVVTYMALTCPWLLLPLFIGSALMVLIYIVVSRRLEALNTTLQGVVTAYQVRAINMINNILQLKVHTLYRERREAMDEAFANSMPVVKTKTHLETVMSHLSSFTVRLVLAVMCLQASHLMTSHALTAGTFVVIAFLLYLLMPSLSALLEFPSQIASMKASYAQLTTVCDEPLEPNGTQKLARIDTISGDGVSLRYDDKTVLSNLSFTLTRGQITLIKGANGTGKSSLISLILGILRSDEGTVRYNGIDIKDIDILDVRRHQISYAEQAPFLLDTTLKDNVTLGLDEIDPARERDVAEAFQLHRWGEDHAISADEVSGGERQRIVLARAMLKNGDVVILDEPTSALDSQTEVHLLKTLNTIKRDKIIILISHDAQVQALADQTIDLDQHHATIVAREAKAQATASSVSESLSHAIEGATPTCPR